MNLFGNSHQHIPSITSTEVKVEIVTLRLKSKKIFTSKSAHTSFKNQKRQKVRIYRIKLSTY